MLQLSDVKLIHNGFAYTLLSAGTLSYYRILDLAEGCYSDLHLWDIKELVYRLAVIGINLE
jgi:hypothetical protein